MNKTDEGRTDYPNDPIIQGMRAAYKAGESIHSIAKATGFSWLKVREIVRMTGSPARDWLNRQAAARREIEARRDGP